MTKKSKSVKDQESEGVINVGHNEVPEDGIGSRIRSARESKGFSQTAVATRSKLVDPNQRGIARTVLVGYESGQFKPGAREIRILCEVLAVTPNWLIYGEDSGYGVKQASMEAVRKNDIISAFRIALAISVLKTHERGAFSSLVLSMAGRELGDLRLSGLLALSTYLAESALKELSDSYAAEMQSTVLTRIQLVNFGCAPTANGAAATTAQPQSKKSAFSGYWRCAGIEGDDVRSLYFGEDGRYGVYAKTKAGDEGYFAGQWNTVDGKVRTTVQARKAIAFSAENMMNSPARNQWQYAGGGWNEQRIESDSPDRIRVIGLRWQDERGQAGPLSTRQECQRLSSNIHAIQFP